MSSQPEDEMTPELKEALAALPREREPGRMLEERTVRALRGQGLLEAPQRRLRFPAAWVVGAAAACLALFTSGIAVGQWMGERRVIRVVTDASSTQQAALQVQQTGSAYVASLAQLQQVSDSASPAQRELARQVALQALRAAANELVRMAPDDPVASGILSGFDQAESARTRPDSTARKPEVVWY